MTTIISRTAWGARAPKDRDLVDPAYRTEFMLHYSTGEELGRDDTYQWVREVQNFHMDGRKWEDIGYNFLVDRLGRIFEGRGWNVIGAHCPNHNTIGIGVCYLGDDDPDVQDATPEARAAIRALAEMSDSHCGKVLKRVGHRDGKATACPGNELYDWLKQGMPLSFPPIAPPPPAPVLAPQFPLPGEHWFGPEAKSRQNHSGYWPADRPHIVALSGRLRERGWGLDPSERFTAHLHGIVKQFQAEAEREGHDTGQRDKRHPDGLVGPKTWRLIWEKPVT